MKKHLTVFAGLTVFALSTCIGSAQETSPTPPAHKGMTEHPAKAEQNTKGTANRLMGADSNFAIKAAQGGMAEVELGNLAKDKASNADVKKFGQTMVDDHGKANDELKQIAAAKGITLPAALDSKHQSLVDRLSKLSGAEFDRAYMKEMLADHKMDVSEFRKQSQAGNDPELKAFAAKTLPTLEQHLQTAQTTEAAVKSESKK